MDTTQQIIDEEITKGVRRVFEEQLKAAESNLYAVAPQGRNRRTGHLRTVLQQGVASVSALADGAVAVAEVPSYMRVLDTKSHGNYKIYNRPLYGVLYGEAMRRLKIRMYEYLAAIPDRGGWSGRK